MNLANEMDLAMDEAVKRRIGHLFDMYFTSMSPPETKTNQLKGNLKLLETDIEIAVKALADL
jgi:hypothetical protein